MTRAEEIIKLQEREENRNSNYRSMCQETAELQFPRDSAITTTYAPGTQKTDTIYDPTAIEDSQIMADGLLQAIVPAGEYFFRLNVSKDNPGGVTEEYKTYLDYATDKQHRAMFASNYMLTMGETLRSLVVFGTGNMYSEWTIEAGGLNFKDYDVGRYNVLVNSSGKVDTMILKFPYTAQQAVEKWGAKVGEKVAKAYADEKTRNDTFWFIHFVSPRKKRVRRLTDFMNMPWEGIFVGVADKNEIDEGGFPEFPFHVPRWSTTSGETHGRGVGTEIQPQVRVMQTMMCDFIEMGNKAPRPPREVLQSFEGEFDVTPDAKNVVQEIPSSRMIETGGHGAYVITKDILEMQRDVIHSAYKKKAFIPLTDLTGDRRNELEIRERKLEGLRQIGQPTGRIQSELLEPQIKRSFMLLVRNGEIPPPPPGLDMVEIEYLGLMANALSSGQARGFQQTAIIFSELEESYPEMKDNINIDEGSRDLARSLGCKAEHINTIEQRDEIREQRAQLQQQQQALEMAQAAGKTYKDTSGAPEDGSLAGAIQNG